MFYYCTKLKNIEFNNNTSTSIDSFVSMKHMFEFCSSLIQVNSKIFETYYLSDLD